MTDEPEVTRPSSQRLDKQLLLKIFSEALVRPRRNDTDLPDGCSENSEPYSEVPDTDRLPRLQK
jgi:hypothetical protein